MKGIAQDIDDAGLVHSYNGFISRPHPSEEFELTANSLGAHIETHGELIFRALS